MKTEKRRPAENVKIKCGDCILKCEEPKIISCWLDPLNCYESQSDDKIILGYCLTDLHSKYGGQFNSLGCSQLDKLSVRLDR